MRMHAIAVALAILAACGESLPAAPDEDDAGDAGDAGDRDASSPTSDAGDVDSGCLVAPCNVTEVVTAKPRAIAASSQAFIWLVDNEVFTLADGDAAAVMRPLNGGAATGFLALDAVQALMTQGSGVDRCSTKAPCADNPGAPIFGLSDTGPVAVGDGDIYAADRAGQRRLVTCGLVQGCGASAQVIAYLPEAATRITLTSAHVVLGFADGSMRAYSRSDRLEAGAAIPPELVHVGDLRGLAADGPDVYWTDGANGRIARCSVASCVTPSDVLTGRKLPRAIAIDGTRRAYWVETDDDAVLRCTLPACADVRVIARVRQPTDLALGDRVYIASDAMQRIYATDP